LDDLAALKRLLKENVEQIAEGLHLLVVEPGQVVELRALPLAGGRGVQSGFYDSDHLPAMARDASQFSERYQGVYFTLNPLNPDLLARRKNWAGAADRDLLAKDQDVLRRRWLLVDVDPKRIAGISSTEEEKGKARQVVEAVRDWLREQGCPDPILTDSGNGYHLLYRIDLASDDNGLVKRVLGALGARFDTEGATVDQTVFNPARICKLPGTWARKGENLPERPHRQSKILDIPNDLRPVPPELLEQVARVVPGEGKGAEGPRQAVTPGPATEASGGAKTDQAVLKRARAYLASCTARREARLE
jgi:hypothetical protein